MKQIKQIEYKIYPNTYKLKYINYKRTKCIKELSFPDDIKQNSTI